ncbi:MAG: ABC transporter permease, partial [Actinobacteria bacterium]|nr:ABC transporter permease [Actinomycetota bacterium]
MKVLAIAWKDLRSTVRNVPALVMMLVAPLALAALLGFAFGGGESFEIAATEVVVANGDTGTPESSVVAGCMVAGILESPGLQDVLRVRRVEDAATARKAVDDGDAAVAVIVPADFSEVVYGDDPSATAQIELYENPTSEVGGSIVEGVVGQVLADFNGARAAAAGAVAVRSDDGGDPPAPQVAAAAAAEAFSHDGGVASGLSIAERSPQVGKTETEVSVTGVILSGMMVFFMF